MVALFVLVTIMALLATEMIVGKLEGRRFNVAPSARPPILAGEALPVGTLFHRGHAWARLDEPGVVTVGVDGFARAMAGEPDEVRLPEVGAELNQGAPGWVLKRGQRDIPMLSPVDGEVIAVNERAKDAPLTISADPYNEGWLLKVRPSRLRANVANLLDGDLAARWMDDSYRRLSRVFSPQLGVVMQDGGSVAQGIVDSIDAEKLPEVMREFFLIEHDVADPVNE